MSVEYDVWFWDPLGLVHKILSNPDFRDEIDYAPVQEYSSNGVHRYQNFMSGNWAWKQAVSIFFVFPFSFLNVHRIWLLRMKEHVVACLYQLSLGVTRLLFLLLLGTTNTGLSTCPLATYIIMCAEHTTMEWFCLAFYLYLLVNTGTIFQHLFEARLYDWLDPYIANNEDTNDVKFHKFRHQLLHSSFARMLKSLKPGMTTPEVVHCPDAHFWHAVYGIGPYIGDYPEQALLACIVQNWCPK